MGVFMLKQTDIEGRLRLLRYGLLVVVVVSFAIALSSHIVFAQDKTRLMDFLGPSLVYTAIMAVGCVAVYWVYARILRRQHQLGYQSGPVRACLSRQSGMPRE